MDPLGRILRGALHVYLARAAGAALLFVAQILLARWMGADGYGIFSFVWVWVWLLAIPAALGLPVASLRFVPTYLARAQRAELRGYLRFAVRAVLGCALLVAAIAILVVIVLAPVPAPGYRMPMAIALLAVPVLALLTLYRELCRAGGWMVLATAPEQVLRPLVLVLLGVAAVRWFGVQSADAFVALGVAAYAAALAVQALLFHRRVAPQVRGAGTGGEPREWLRTALPLVVVTGSQIVFTQIDLVMVGLLRPPAEVGYYAAAVRTVSLLTVIAVGVNGLLIPSLSTLFAEGRRDSAQRLYTQSTRWSFAGVALCAVVLAVARGPLLELFGTGFSAATGVLLILVAGQIAVAGIGPVGSVLGITGHEGVGALLAGLAALLNVVLNYVLIRALGIEGAALGTAVTLVLLSVAQAAVTARRVQLTPGIVGRPAP